MKDENIKINMGTIEADLNDLKYETTKVQENIPLYGRLVSAISGGILTSLLMTPFDVVKVRLQVQSTTGNNVLLQEIKQNTSFNRTKQLPNVKNVCEPTGITSCACHKPGTFMRKGVVRFELYKKIMPKFLINTWSPRSAEFGLRNWNSNVCLLHSKDYLKTFGDSGAYLNANKNLLGSLNNYAAEGATESRLIRGTWHGFTSIFKMEGITGLWRGLGVTLVAALPSTVVYFVGYDLLRDQIRNRAAVSNNKTLDIYAPLVAGCLARTTSATVISPLELIRTKMQTSSTQKLSVVIKDIAKTIKIKGIRTLYAGLIPTLWRDVPFSAIYWLAYERTRKTILNNQNILDRFIPYQTNSSYNKYVDLSHAFVSGATAGSIAAIITNPFDVAKTKRQAVLNMHHKDAKVITILKNIVETEGLKGFYTGLTPRLMKIAPACAIMITSYEFGKSVFK
ncbi:hypothetical protein BB558_005928 [Smittium angustum]|uniref:Mitochondrial carrier protein n=1 Tax=Smittium angustum TaxID=133377 RepID=A0A2U1IZ25_SMIAN|nr:hypothetical protein BB558_005928 [Smittium angustum]